MSDENTSQNPTPEENSLPASSEGPTEQGLENTAHSETSDAPPLAPESPPGDFEVKSTILTTYNS